MVRKNTHNQNSHDELESFREKCRQGKLSVTPQRVAIYNVLIGSDNHPTAEDVYNRVMESFPDISLDTIYRTLGTFARLGIIDIVEGYGQARRYDPDTGPHHHFWCRQCGAIVDFHNHEFESLDVPEDIGKKYRVTGIKVVLEGICDNCGKS
jgi:Fur family peroxide stress response transcriptional regulator